MSSLVKARYAPGITHRADNDPTDIPGAKVHDFYLDATDGEHWTCVDDTPAAQVWKGSQQPIAGEPAIASSTHPNLTFFYTMNDADIVGTTITDISPAGNDGVMSSAFPTTTGKLGEAIDTDASSAHVTVPNGAADLGGFAFSLWINPTTLGGSGGDARFISVWRGSSYYAMIRYDSLKRLQAFINGDSGLSSETIEFGTWAHIVFQCAHGDTFQVWLDGVKVLQGANNSDLSTPAVTQFRLAAGHIGLTEFDGLMDQVRCFNRVLTEQEITDLYNSGAGW